MRVLVICAAFCATALGSPQESGLTLSARDAIEKAVLEVNAQMTRAAEDRDIDRLFSFMLPNERGSIIQSGKLFPARDVRCRRWRTPVRNSCHPCRME